MTCGSSEGLDESLERRGAESGVVADQHAPVDPQLRAIIDAWPTLSRAVKAGIVALVRAAEEKA